MFRKNVAAIIICQGKYLGCYRSDYNTWQCVQGGMEPTDPTPTHAIIREIQEELGVSPSDFKIIHQSKFWRRYYFTPDILKNTSRGNHIGQEQLWFVAELNQLESVHLEKSHGEFSKVELFDIDFYCNNTPTGNALRFMIFAGSVGLYDSSVFKFFEILFFPSFQKSN